MCKAKQVATCKDVEVKIKDLLIKGKMVIIDSRREIVHLDSIQTGVFETVPNRANFEEGHYNFRIYQARVCKMVDGNGIMSRMATLNGAFKLSFDSASNIVVNIESVAVVEYLN